MNTNLHYKDTDFPDWVRFVRDDALAWWEYGSDLATEPEEVVLVVAPEEEGIDWERLREFFAMFEDGDEDGTAES